MVIAMCGVQLIGRKRSTDLMLMLGLCETMDELAVANSVRWYGHVLKREDGHVLIRLLDLEVEGHGRKGRPKRTWKRRLRKKV